MQTTAIQQPADTAAALTANHPLVVNLRRRLERWELTHLRQLAQEQADRIELLEHDLENERARSEFWARECDSMMDELRESGQQIGLKIDGELVVVKGGAA